ncbi:pentafunctional aromatic polypeptide Aro1 [Schizosaccharomyces cryophilus OY26]|uniref:Pentafunctional AROM polypeptide n=1 Tax=Schizosaccharomyces cryophilus (strain OY26 / ATCC MYA-4695 / CBS 11777 / NBRC 106824 / NRRL Y48691) TaxID=653667 RepID=S9VVU8_SCHCR|nr:pentafunctional aromatic polypeptide Aro1 [Schizosaccharomyces cryophilus OY26]EPY50300.1 pentafunctional aromatic polypeptide Aro1 [Schizosaccharomyces cryophilus OY26]
MSSELDMITVPILGKETVKVGFGLNEYVATEILKEFQSSTYIVITDSNIAPHHLEPFERTFRNTIKKNGAESRFLSYIIPPGESSKCRAMKAEIEDWMLSQSCTRDTLLIAMGGGVIGDLVGYVAATFMRGIRFVQMPTTLLAMVDSSIGGKTGIDAPLGKNLIGAFWQPLRVYVDLLVLHTLSPRQVINGLAEIIKTAAMWNEKDFQLLENNSSILMEEIHKPAVSGEYKYFKIKNLLQKIILSSIRTKCEVVTLDEREGGLRNLLNFGHSIGHAYEAILYPQILHGECVAIGMIKEVELARHLGVLKPNAVGRLAKCLVSYGLPVSVNDPKIKKYAGFKDCPVENLILTMAVDKKNQGSKKRVVILKAIGETYEKHATVVSDDDIRFVLSSDVKVGTFTEHSLDVVVTPPGSKSISNRALVLAALSQGTCRLTNMLHSDDTQFMMSALESLGAAKFSWEDNGETLVVEGSGGKMSPPKDALYLGNAGTAARFLTGVSALVPTKNNEHGVVLTGNHRMKVRPIGPLVDALRNNGCTVKYLEKEGSLPLSMSSESGLKGGVIELAATVSSQYVSSILMCAPYASEPVTLKLVGGKPISQLYIDMTIAMMASFGINVQKSSTEENTYHIPQANYQSPSNYEIESDASSATYPLAIAALTGTKCTIPNIGSSSLQGDSRFARDVLKPMGCLVEQTATSTTVQGPPKGKLKPLESVDMETMTDAFLTASVVAAVASNAEGDAITRITGIGNQRVKECNRIAAMVHELSKFGVRAGELEDGIYIFGKDYKTLNSPEGGVYTYDDHRVAMAFSLLAILAPSPTVVIDKACVEKTWPSWWDALRNSFRVSLHGSTIGNEQQGAVINKNASIILIGMRGAGKTTIGKIISKQLDMEFVDLDELLEDHLAMPITEVVFKLGWDAFRHEEHKLLREFIRERPHGFVAASGGGVIEMSESRKLLENYVKDGGIVLHVHRNLDHIVSYLSKDITRPAYKDQENIRDVYGRRHQWYRQCRSHYFISPVLDERVVEEKIESSMSRFLEVITGKTRSLQQLTEKNRSTFLTLNFPNVEQALPLLNEVSLGCDAIEIRVDHLKDPKAKNGVPTLDFVAEQVALLRCHTRLPIIFTVRTKKQGGLFPDDKESEALELVLSAIRYGINFVDVELGWSIESITKIYESKRNTKLLMSWHDVSGTWSWARPHEWMQKIELASSFADIIKLVGTAKTFNDNLELENFRNSVTRTMKIPLIAINMGSKGQLSRIFNKFLTPVTHPDLPSKAAPGQLSVKQLHEALALIGEIVPQKFYVFGKPISHSRSPVLHNTAYGLLGLPHTYQAYETNSVEEVESVLHSPDFGGANVTIPYKLPIMRYMDELSHEARFFGAVNTIIPTVKDGKLCLRGDNTDWRGIYDTFTAALDGMSLVGSSALVIGAGGTSRAAVYTLHHLGVSDIYLVNRTVTNSYAVQNVFPPEYNIKVLDADKVTPEEIKGVSIASAISTVPADIALPEGVDRLVKTLIATGDKQSIFLDMAYKPLHTPLMAVASEHGWRCSSGLEVLVRQGLASFQMWTGLNAPFIPVYKKVIE